MTFATHLIFLSLTLTFVTSNFIDFEQAGGIPNSELQEHYDHNKNLINEIFENFKPNDVFYLPNKTFYSNGGIVMNKKSHITLLIDGTLKFQGNRNTWPKEDENNPDSLPKSCVEFHDLYNDYCPLKVQSKNL